MNEILSMMLKDLKTNFVVEMHGIQKWLLYESFVAKHI